MNITPLSDTVDAITVEEMASNAEDKTDKTDEKAESDYCQDKDAAAAANKVSEFSFGQSSAGIGQ